MRVGIDPAGRHGQPAQVDIGLVRGGVDARDLAVFDHDLLVAKHLALAIDDGGGLDSDGLGAGQSGHIGQYPEEEKTQTILQHSGYSLLQNDGQILGRSFFKAFQISSCIPKQTCVF
jgi:hypothetical protein